MALIKLTKIPGFREYDIELGDDTSFIATTNGINYHIGQIGKDLVIRTDKEELVIYDSRPEYLAKLSELGLKEEDERPLDAIIIPK